MHADSFVDNMYNFWAIVYDSAIIYATNMSFVLNATTVYTYLCSAGVYTFPCGYLLL